MKRIWRTRDGTKIKIKDMTTSHIQNCINLLERANQSRLSLLYAIEQTLQGEQAQYAIAIDIERAEDGYFGPDDLVTQYLESLRHELAKRKEAK